jgi:hypothetical protein
MGLNRYGYKIIFDKSSPETVQPHAGIAVRLRNFSFDALLKAMVLTQAFRPGKGGYII